MFKLVVVIVLYLLFCTVSYSAPADEQIQRDIQQRIQEDLRQRELDEVLKPPTELETPPPATAPDFIDDGNCVQVNEISYSGNTVFSNKRLNRLIAPYIGKCLTVTNMDTMLQAFAHLYIGAGYTTSMAYIAVEQPRIAEGVLEIKVIEGKVAQIILNNIKNSERFVSFSDITGKPLYLRDIEQGIDQMNRLPSNKVTISVEPASDSTNASSITFTNDRGDSTSISVTVDNLGSVETGEWRWGLRLSQDSLLNINDRIDIGFNKAFNSDPGDQDFNSVIVGLSAPFRYFTFSNNFSYSDYTTNYVLEQSGERFYTMGDSYNDTFSIDWLYLRGKKFKLSAAIGYTYKKSENYMKVLDFEMRNAASSRVLSSAYVELPSTFYLPWGVLYFKPSYQRGIKLFGALDDDESIYPQRAQYKLWRSYLYYAQGVSMLNLMLIADGQYSDDELYGSEGFSIGGEGTVRGFKEESATGDKGIVLKAELSGNLGVLFSKEFLNPYKVAIFYDWGSTSSNSEYIAKVKLAGAGVSLSVDYKYFNASISYATALSKPDLFDESAAVYCRMGFQYSF